MQIIYKDSKMPNSISKSVFIKSKVVEDLFVTTKALEKLGYDGTVFTNHFSNPKNISVNENFVDYEKVADVIIDLNIESLDDVNKAINSPIINRIGGEVYIPAYIWQTAQFKSWYKDLIKAGNRLDRADVLYHYTTPSGFVFSYVMKVAIWVEKEKRFKSNEIIISRRNVSNVIAYTDDKIVLVKEFRSPVSNHEGFVYELPGGSSFDDAVDPLENARIEFFEEVGYMVNNKKRFKHISDRQLAATVSTHKANLYAIKLTNDEMDIIEEIGNTKEKETLSIADSDEHTYTVVVNKEDLFKLPVDFSTIGMIYSAII